MRVAKTTSPKETVAEYLKRPYARVVLPETDGTFRAEIIEFPGCIAVGDTAVQALSSLEDVAASWLTSVLENQQQVPEPIDRNAEYSGKLVLRLPKTLHKKAAHAADLEGVSLNQFIMSSVAEQVGECRYRLVALPNLISHTHVYFWGTAETIPLRAENAQQSLTLSTPSAFSTLSTALTVVPNARS